MKILNFVLIVLCFVPMLTGCFAKQINFSNEIEGTLNIVGSSSTQEVCDALASAFMKKYDKIEIVKSGAGSAQAAVAVLNLNAQIGDLSRNLNYDEHPEEFKIYEIAKDGIAVCTNLKNKIKNLTKFKLKQIFTGEIKNWKDIGGSNAPIVVLGRDEASGTRAGFEKFIDAKNECAYLIEQDSNGKIKEKIKNDEHAIGYISLSSVDELINVVEIDGVTPSFENVSNLTYKLTQPFIQIVKKNFNDDLVDLWFNFVFSNEGAKIIEKFKFVPIKK